MAPHPLEVDRTGSAREQLSDQVRLSSHRVFLRKGSLNDKIKPNEGQRRELPSANENVKEGHDGLILIPVFTALVSLANLLQPHWTRFFESLLKMPEQLHNRVVVFENIQAVVVLW